ncbi:hypothetical protein D3C72_1903450 [compost metagenome]
MALAAAVFRAHPCRRTAPRGHPTRLGRAERAARLAHLPDGGETDPFWPLEPGRYHSSPERRHRPCGWAGLHHLPARRIRRALPGDRAQHDEQGRQGCRHRGLARQRLHAGLQVPGVQLQGLLHREETTLGFPLGRLPRKFAVPGVQGAARQRQAPVRSGRARWRHLPAHSGH